LQRIERSSRKTIQRLKEIPGEARAKITYGTALQKSDSALEKSIHRAGLDC
jgi:hypothetical protein